MFIKFIDAGAGQDLYINKDHIQAVRWFTADTTDIFVAWDRPFRVEGNVAEVLTLINSK